MNKKISLMIFSFVFIFILMNQSHVHAESPNPITVFVNQDQIKFDINPVIQKGYTLVQFRPIFEKLNIQFSWNGKDQSITGSDSSTKTNFKLAINNKNVFLNGKQETLTISPVLINNSTFVPLRFVSEAVGKDIHWDGDTRVITITDKIVQPTIPPTVEKPKLLSTEQIGELGNQVVYIEANDKNGNPIATGSGIVISNDGEILTNYHVLDNASSVKVIFINQKEYKTTQVVSYDIDKDLAIIKIDATNLPYATLGDSSKLKLGQNVVAIGSPLGYKNSLTTGVVSSTSRNIDDHDYIQISTPIDRGSSGGALFNMYGNVVGVTSSGVQSQADINLAIPSDVVKGFLNRKLESIDLNDMNKKNLAINIKKFLDEGYFSLIYTINNEQISFPFDYKVTLEKNGLIWIRMSTKDNAESDSLINSYKLDKNLFNLLTVTLGSDIHKKFNVDILAIHIENQKEEYEYGCTIDYIKKTFEYVTLPKTDYFIMGTLYLN